MTEHVAALADRYAAAWNRHDLDAIVRMHAPGMVFENHTTLERADGDDVRDHVARIFESWPDLRFDTRRRYAREGLVVHEWTATATHSRGSVRGNVLSPPTGRVVTWEGVDILVIADGLVARKDVYSDRLAVLRQTAPELAPNSTA